MQTIERKKGKKRLCSTNLKVHKNMKKAVICLIPFNESKNVNEVTKKKQSHIDMKLYLLENIYKNKICKKAILINNHAK